MKKAESKIRELYVTENEIFQFPKMVLELSDNEIFAVRNASSPYRVSKVFNIDINYSSNYSFCWKVENSKGIRYYNIVEIFNNILISHMVVWKVIEEWSKVRYSINFLCLPDKVKEGRIKISKYPIGVASLANINYFTSIEELKKKSSVYKNLSNQEKQWICIPKNITVIKDRLIIPSDFGDDNSTAKKFKHILLGDINDRKFKGIHHIHQVLKGNAKIIEVINSPNKNGVWQGRLLLKDLRNNKLNHVNKWKSKHELSTFFPNNWDNIELIEECKYAWSNKIIQEKLKSSNKWYSKTKSGISVVIYTDKEDNIITMYPNWDIESTI